MKDSLSRYILFVYLLPVFFVLHGFTGNYNLVPVRPALKLLLIYLLAALAFLILFQMLFRNIYKAGLLSFLLMGYYFFFGAVQDMLYKAFPGAFLSRYSFILPASLVVFIFLFIYLKKTKKPLLKTTLYLNALFLLLVLVDTGWLISKLVIRSINEVVPKETLARCSNCPAPDIYLIVADGYPGKTQLQEILGYDNTAFEEQLRQRGFHITDSSLANYNFTFFSMSSALNMNYLNGVSGSIQNKKNIPAGSRALKNNQVLGFLKVQGYHFFNYSHLDFKGNPSVAKPTFWINDTRPLTQQTFLSRLNRDLGYHLVTTFRIKPADPFPIYLDLQNNNQLFSETIKTVSYKSTGPKFVYTHLIMPHHPYYFDSLGNKTPLSSLTKEFAFDKAAAVSYIVYANKKYLELVDMIIAGSAKPPIIILISDHGFREIKEDKDKKTMFLNLDAVLFPGKDYGGFYKGMSNVNLFRVILNSQFKQQLPLIKDSTVYLKD